MPGDGAANGGLGADQWTTMALSVTSLRSHNQAIYELGGDLLLLTETRTPADSTGDLMAAAQRMGYSLRFGQPVPRGPDRNRPCFGGVAIAAQGHLKLELLRSTQYGIMQF